MESLAQKATRGAGYAWGIAEDAGRSARWFAAHRLGWAAPLLAVLDARPPNGECPLHLGAFLSDSVGARETHAFARVAAPAWLVPPLAGQGAAMWLDDVAVALPRGASVSASIPWDALLAIPSGGVRVMLGTGPLPAEAHTATMGAGRADVPDHLLVRLSAYAAQTTVPSSPHSRAAGAGGTNRDED